MNKNIIHFFLGFLIAMLINGPASANELENGSQGKAVNHETAQANGFPVRVDLIIDEVSDISISHGRFQIVAELLLSWTGNNAGLVDASGSRTLVGDTIETFFAESFNPSVFIANAESPREVIARSLTLFPDGRVELFEKFAVSLGFETNIPAYPFGDLDLHLELQSANHALPELDFKPRHFEFGHEDIDHSIVKGNWYLLGKSSEVASTKSLSHGGKSHFSVAIFHIKVAHDFFDVAQKILIPLLSILLLSMFINRYIVIYATETGGDNGNWRVGGQLTLLLTLFALKFSLGDDIPATHYLTMVDALFVAVGFIVVVVLMWGIYVIYLFQSGNVELGHKFEHKSNSVFFFAALILMVWVSSFVFLN